MTPTKISNKQLVMTIDFANNMVKREDKLGHYCRMLLDSLKPSAESFNKEVKKLRLKHSAVDKNNCVILNEKSDYSFTKEGLTALEEEMDLLMDSEIELPKINWLLVDSKSFSDIGEIPQEYEFLRGIIFE
jgi:hypothetical protein